MVTYYKILNINRDATNKDVRNAFIKTINYMKNNNIETSTISKVKKAYKILSEYHTRRDYDDILDNKTQINSVIAPNIDGFFRPMLRNSILDDRMSNHFIEAEQEFKEMTKQFMNKKDSNSNSYNYVQRKSSNGKKDIYYNGQGKIINQ
jgi:DnaJ-class molecular chaperone